MKKIYITILIIIITTIKINFTFANNHKHHLSKFLQKTIIKNYQTKTIIKNKQNINITKTYKTVYIPYKINKN